MLKMNTQEWATTKRRQADNDGEKIIMRHGDNDNDNYNEEER